VMIQNSLSFEESTPRPAGWPELAEVLNANNSADVNRWTALVENLSNSDAYFLPEYTRATAEIEQTEPLALIAGPPGERILAPVLVRHMSATFDDSKMEWLDAATPYGYGGLLNLSDRCGMEAIPSFFQQLHVWCASRRIVCCVIRLHPLLHALVDQQKWIDHAGPWRERLQVHHRGATYSIRLSEWNLELNQPANLRRDRKADMRLAARHVDVIRGMGSDDDIDAKLGIFTALYWEMTDRKRAESFYRFPEAYFEKLTKLGKRFGIVIAMHGTEPAGANLFLFGSRYAHGHLSVVNEIGRKYGTATLLNIEGARWARRAGCELFHLGGGLSRGDPLEEFKRSFGGPAHVYRYMTFIADPERFEIICKLPAAPWPYHLASSPVEAGEGNTA
jgi:Acetyltransferase (GNAT) domain